MKDEKEVFVALNGLMACIAETIGRPIPGAARISDTDFEEYLVTPTPLLGMHQYILHHADPACAPTVLKLRGHTLQDVADLCVTVASIIAIEADHEEEFDIALFYTLQNLRILIEAQERTTFLPFADTRHNLLLLWLEDQLRDDLTDVQLALLRVRVERVCAVLQDQKPWAPIFFFPSTRFQHQLLHGVELGRPGRTLPLLLCAALRNALLEQHMRDKQIFRTDKEVRHCLSRAKHRLVSEVVKETTFEAPLIECLHRLGIVPEVPISFLHRGSVEHSLRSLQKRRRFHIVTRGTDDGMLIAIIPSEGSSFDPRNPLTESMVEFLRNPFA